MFLSCVICNVFVLYELKYNYLKRFLEANIFHKTPRTFLSLQRKAFVSPEAF